VNETDLLPVVICLRWNGGHGERYPNVKMSSRTLVNCRNGSRQRWHSRKSGCESICNHPYVESPLDQLLHPQLVLACSPFPPHPLSDLPPNPFLPFIAAFGRCPLMFYFADWIIYSTPNLESLQYLDLILFPIFLPSLRGNITRIHTPSLACYTCIRQSCCIVRRKTLYGKTTK